MVDTGRIGGSTGQADMALVAGHTSGIVREDPWIRQRIEVD